MESQAFKVYTIDHGAIQSAEVKDTEGQGHGALAGLLTSMKPMPTMDVARAMARLAKREEQGTSIVNGQDILHI
ncbi:MAG: hypothetical protein II145_08500 [Selenomonas sp.]|jgi:hypothetical protein|nr:hypothetical protein [Selenomonas sp.]MCI7331303.1 hypothetical protein [Selenomonadaceae bacterium]MDD6120463.1 hypothetical protein [Selenomonadaceae bacterium]MDY3916216.1 hypothetical protein [Selenomonadaceae bacterium]